MTEFPQGWTTRRPTLDDVPAILALVHASDVAAVGEPDYTADEIREDLTTPNTDMARDCLLALDDAGRIVGWSFPGNSTGGARDMANVYFWPGHGLPALTPLLELLMARMTERAAELGHDVYEVRAGAIPGETELIAALTDAGFIFLKQFARMQMSLDGVSTVAPEPPAGITVRPVRHDDETELRTFHAVIEDAFVDSDHRAIPFDGWREQISKPGTPFDEWFVAEADGRIVGALQSSDGGEDTDEGWVKHLATLRAYRKRGVGETLLRRAFATYAAKGRPKAGLGVDLANPTDAASLYLKVGMDALYRANIYRTTVKAAS